MRGNARARGCSNHRDHRRTGTSGSRHHVCLRADCYSHGCPCGYAGDRERACTCSSQQIGRYTKRISGPLLDRIDIHLDVPRVPYEKLTAIGPAESSATVRARVEAARARQRDRFSGTSAVTNADMGPGEVRQFCPLDAAGEQLMRAASRQMHLSARSHHRIIKLARTIADLAGADQISASHIAEALQYRPRELTV